MSKEATQAEIDDARQLLEREGYTVLKTRCTCPYMGTWGHFAHCPTQS